MSLIYFDSLGEGLCEFEEPAGGVLYTNALLIVEGTHKDNKGVTHDFPAYLIQQFAENTNKAMQRGVEIPFMVEHAKQLVSGSAINKLGELHEFVRCKIIQAEDLPDSRQTHLIGKLGAFSKIAVRDRIDAVKKKLIKKLSPGIDLINKRIAEVSAVAYPAIEGPALFSSYQDIKSQRDATAKIREKAIECLQILLDAIAAIENTTFENAMAFNPNAAKRKAVADFTADLIEQLAINDEPEPELLQRPDPYKTEMVAGNASYNSSLFSQLPYGSLTLAREPPGRLPHVGDGQRKEPAIPSAPLKRWRSK
jgi:hypothetical protein